MIKLPGQATWSRGTCGPLVAPRSYDVHVDGTTYRRNRRDIRDVPREHHSPPATNTTDEDEVAAMEERLNRFFAEQSSDTPADNATPQPAAAVPEPPRGAVTTELRRSKRTVKKPQRYGHD